jgi:hypothetical protein
LRVEQSGNALLSPEVFDYQKGEATMKAAGLTVMIKQGEYLHPVKKVVISRTRKFIILHVDEDLAVRATLPSARIDGTKK